MNRQCQRLDRVATGSGADRMQSTARMLADNATRLNDQFKALLDGIRAA